MFSVLELVITTDLYNLSRVMLLGDVTHLSYYNRRDYYIIVKLDRFYY